MRTDGEMVEAIAIAFHSAYEAAAPANGYATRPETRCAWRDLPKANRATMIATVQRLLDRHVIEPGTRITTAARSG